MLGDLQSQASPGILLLGLLSIILGFGMCFRLLEKLGEGLFVIPTMNRVFVAWLKVYLAGGVDYRFGSFEAFRIDVDGFSVDVEPPIRDRPELWR